ncbi:c-type cytochrome [Prosthecobacter sp.]|uniref:c-type cytochrome n=1 Tax=Prosthecobacter sp. TaxID=1965333 RepID=UPI001D5F695F|nr:c-type cytochrome [Prosthecobacter sp.]MCB1278966.1 c-type cytochrome [Prosthecobacter sp.]
MNFIRQPLVLLILGLNGAVSHAADPKPPVHAVDPVHPAIAATKATKATDGKAIFQAVCAQCHGANGEGKIEMKTPSIAGMPSWYVTTQFANFREGRRGQNAADAQPFMMASIAKALQPEQVKAVIGHVEKMPVVVPTGKDREMTNVDPGEGMQLFQERCMECHRYNASGEMAFGSPPLIGRQAWYLEEQLKRFKAGKRGAVKNDVNGAKMVQMAKLFIEDDQMLRNVVAYIMTLNPEPEQPAPLIEGSPFKDEVKTAER